MKNPSNRAWTKYGLVALVTALIVAPTAAIASHGFTDVPDTHLFHNNIQWMKDNGVTLGCNPPANDKYCPSNTVNRGQMAAFMQRLAENKVVDAATAVTAESATTAGNADKLDGLDSSAFIPAGVITTSYDGGDWEQHALNAAPTVNRFVTNTQISGGNGALTMSLEGPTGIGGLSYGLETFTFCATGGGTVTNIQVYQTTGTTNPSVFQATDTPYSPNGCVTYDVNSGGVGVTTGMWIQTTGSLTVYGIDATWSVAAATAEISGTTDSPGSGG